MARFQVRLNNLKKIYKERTVLDIDELVLESNRTYALVGPNGSGKSTLLRIMSGITDSSGGTIGASGELEKEQIRVGYAPQKSYAFGFSVFKNVAMALKGQGLSRDEISERVHSSLAALGMEKLANARGSSLSGGEAQRMALARILVQDLDMIILDEPTASMDITGTMIAEDALMSYRERTGCLLLVATHAPSQARRISEHVIMLSDGHMVEFGRTDEVLTHPSSEQGAEFLSYWAV